MEVPLVCSSLSTQIGGGVPYCRGGKPSNSRKWSVINSRPEKCGGGGGVEGVEGVRCQGEGGG